MVFVLCALILAAGVTEAIKVTYLNDVKGSHGEFVCSNGIHVSGKQKCDGKNDCGNWDDECSCDEPQPSLCHKKPCLNGDAEIRRRQMCDGYFDCKDLSDECLCDIEREENKMTYRICQSIFSDNSSNCTIGTIPCLGAKRERNVPCIPGNRICDGEIDCKEGIDERFCRPSINFTNTPDISVSSKNDTQTPKFVVVPEAEETTNCDRFFFCSKTGLEQNQCRSSDKRFQLEGVESEFIDWRRTFDGVADCDDFSDEWTTRCSGNCSHGFSHLRSSTEFRVFYEDRYIASPKFLFKYRAFAVLQWVIGFITVFANSYVICRILRSFYQGEATSSGSVKLSNHIMILSLAVGDLAIGIYMVAIAAVDAAFAESFWKHEIDWITSTVCSVFGTLVFITTFASVFSGFTIALIRLYTVLHPFTRLRIRNVTIAAATAWGLATLQALVPEMKVIRPIERYFTVGVAIPNLTQSSTYWQSRGAVEKLMAKVVSLHDMNERRVTTAMMSFRDMSWGELEEYMNDVNPNFGKWKYFDWYSQSSMCVPPVIISITNKTWHFTVASLSENLCAYTFVIIAYGIVLRKTTKFRIFKRPCNLCFHTNDESSSKCDTETDVSRKTSSAGDELKQRRKREDSDIQRRIFWLVLTDITCWIPVCLLNYINTISPNSNVKTTVSVFICTILVELNSMINPFVYSKHMRSRVKMLLSAPFRAIRCGRIFRSPDNEKQDAQNTLPDNSNQTACAVTVM